MPRGDGSGWSASARTCSTPAGWCAGGRASRVAAVLSLALGIGANTAVFSLMHALLLEHLPVQRPQELVRLAEYAADGSYRDAFTYTTYDTLRRGSTLLSSVVMLTQTSVRNPREIEERGEKSLAYVQMVSDNYFDALGVGARLGRVFHELGAGRGTRADRGDQRVLLAATLRRRSRPRSAPASESGATS